MLETLARWADLYLRGTVEVLFALIGLLDNWHPLAAIALILGIVAGTSWLLPHWLLVALTVLIAFPYIVLMVELALVTWYLEVHHRGR